MSFEQVLSVVQQYLGEDVNESGVVLNNGGSSLRRGMLYLMGFNPGGSPGTIQPTVLESIQELKHDHCAFTDECWTKSHPVDCHIDECKGNSRHQRTVCALVNTLDLEVNIKDVFATNAVFLRSQSQDTLKLPWDLWEKCWPVHRLLLSIVHPKLILCLGNGDGLSAFSLLRSKFSGAPIVQHCGPNGFRDGKWFAGRVAVGQVGPQELECVVVGVPHPSRYGTSRSLQHYLQELRNRLTA